MVENSLTSLFIVLFTSLLVAEFLHSFVLRILNTNELLKNRDRVPSFFEGSVEEVAYQKSVAYSFDNERIALFSLTLSFLFSLFVLYSGILGRWDAFLRHWIESPSLRGLLFTFGTIFFLSLPSFPLQIYRIFVIEERHGFNKYTLKTYFLDQVKQSILSLLLLSPLLLLLYSFIEKISLWWFWAWLALFLFQLVVTWLYPVLIAPLFNRFTPLEEGSLKTRFEALALRCHFPIRGIYVMDGSRRSAHSNAYFTGIGKVKRIVFYDTLLETLSEEELEAVLAHEIGHYKKKHIQKSLILGQVLSLLSFWVLSQIITFRPLFSVFGIEVVSSYTFLVLISLYSSPLSHFLTPLSSLLSRKHEYEADRYASEATGNTDWLKGGLLKLSKTNLSNLTPHPAFSSFYFSHPPLIDRLRYLESISVEDSQKKEPV